MSNISKKSSSKQIFLSLILLSIVCVIFLSLNNPEVIPQELYNLVKIHVAETNIIEELEADPAAMDRVRRIRNYDFH